MIRIATVSLYVLSFDAAKTRQLNAQLAIPQITTPARDRTAELAVAKSLKTLLADQHMTGLTRYDPPLLNEGVCSSVLKNSWVHLLTADEGPQAFYQTDDPSQPTRELQNMAVDTALHYKSMSRFAVAVWKQRLAGGSSRYWVAVVLAKSAVSDWFGSHLGADAPQEMRSPNYEAREAVIPECRHK
jgi:hypothetical protein